jgi:mevalonate kinase
MKKTTIITPGKLILLGEHAVVYGYPCIVTTVNRYLTIIVSENNRTNDEIITSELSGKEYITGIINSFRNKYQKTEKLTVKITSQLTGFGLGSSAALTIGLVKALNEFWGINMVNEDIFNFSLLAVRKSYPLASGFDLAACLYGGTVYYSGQTKKAEHIQTSEFPLLVVFTGNKVSTKDIVYKVKLLKEKNSNLVNNLFDDIGRIVKQSKDVLKRGDWVSLGKLMNRNQHDLVKLGVSTRKIDMIVGKSLEKGAYGAKLSGAGGGDCVLVLISPETKNNIIEVVNNLGGEILDVKFGVEGARIC